MLSSPPVLKSPINIKVIGGKASAKAQKSRCHLAGNWLDRFAYRIDISLWMFAFASLLSLLVAGLTVSWHATRAALSDPVQSLHYE